MPERIVVPITTCKYDKVRIKDKNGVIKIDLVDTYKRTKATDKRFNKRVLGKEKPTFTDFLVTIDNEADALKLEAFCHYIEQFDVCWTCRKKKDIALDRAHCNSDYELVLPCDNCLSNNVEGSPQSKEYCKWWDAYLKNWGLSFLDGHPKGVRAEWGERCLECGGNHTGAGFEFSFNSRDGG